MLKSLPNTRGVPSITLIVFYNFFRKGAHRNTQFWISFHSAADNTNRKLYPYTKRTRSSLLTSGSSPSQQLSIMLPTHDSILYHLALQFLHYTKWGSFNVFLYFNRFGYTGHLEIRVDQYETRGILVSPFIEVWSIQ